jgi:hypothetical protein
MGGVFRPGMGVAMIWTAALAAIGGTLFLVHARDLTQAGLDRARALQPQGAAQSCPAQFDALGLGDLPTLGVLVVALAALGTGLFVLKRAGPLNHAGVTAAFIAALANLVLWVDTYGVARSPIGDCDGIGVGGAAGIALDRAGGLLFLSLALSVAVACWFQMRTGRWFQ